MRGCNKMKTENIICECRDTDSLPIYDEYDQIEAVQCMLCGEVTLLDRIVDNTREEKENEM